ncbi:MAG: N-acetylmuramoyl-L-alanine amidase [Syntrophales bacterium]|nr:N-acetylmuramoyl-L-alanine amidase [Syntrophales bacterium]
MIPFPILKLIISSVILCFSLTQYTHAEVRAVVVIDAAHGGKDLGVRITEKIYEKDITLNLALMLQRELQKVPGINVILTRHSDIDVGLEDRLKIINNSSASAMISLHINAGFYRDAKGFEVYFPGFRHVKGGSGESADIISDMTRTKYLNESVRLAQKVLRSLDTVFPKEGRGLREAPIPLLERVTLPAVLVEVGFATNEGNRKKILDPKYQHEIARCLAKGFVEYLKR